MPHKRLYFDLETTGTNPYKHGFFQMATIIEVDNKVVEEEVYWCKPDGIPDPETMKFHGFELDEFEKEKYQSCDKFYLSLKKKLSQYVNKFDKRDKFHMVGYNIHSFDVPFLRKCFENRGDVYFGSWFWHPPIDVMLLFADALQDRRFTISNFKNATIAELLGITVDQEKLHEAMYDITITRQLYQIYLQQYRP